MAGLICLLAKTLRSVIESLSKLEQAPVSTQIPHADEESKAPMEPKP